MVPGNEGGVWHACLQGVLTVHGMDVQHHVLMANRSTTRPEHVRARVRPDTLLHPLPLSPHTHTHPHPSTNPPPTHTRRAVPIFDSQLSHIAAELEGGDLEDIQLQVGWRSCP